MNLLTLGISLAFFVFGALLAVSFSLLFVESKYLKKKAVKKRLLYMSGGRWHGQEKFAVYREKTLASANPFIRFTLKLPRINKLNKMILSAGMDANPWVFIMASITLAAAGLLAGFVIPRKIPGIQAGLAILFASLPFVFLQIKININRKKFIEQFPEALDLLSRALRSGHAFTSGLAMVTEQMEAPIKNEFGSIVDEVNFGLSLKDALLNMCERVPVTDLKFFAVAVLIQSETGGNIAEVMDNISRILRERVQFKRQVNSLTAEGRASAVILMVLPVMMFLYLYTVNYEYVALLWREVLGRKMLAFGIVMQIIGALVLTKMVKIEA